MMFAHVALWGSLRGCLGVLRYPIAFCQMPCVLSEAEVCIRLLAGIFTRPAVAGMVLCGVPSGLPSASASASLSSVSALGSPRGCGICMIIYTVVVRIIL